MRQRGVGRGRRCGSRARRALVRRTAGVRPVLRRHRMLAVRVRTRLGFGDNRPVAVCRMRVRRLLGRVEGARWVGGGRVSDGRVEVSAVIRHERLLLQALLFRSRHVHHR